MSADTGLRRQELIARLRKYLSELSADSHRTLIRSIDRSRANGNNMPVHAIIMEALREVADEEARVERTLSAERAFFAPLEPIMRSMPLPDKQMGVIDRSSLRRIWIWITRDLAPGRCDGALAALRAAVVDDDEDAVDQLVDDFQKEVSRQTLALMDEIEKKHGSLKRLEGQLGSSRVLADLQDMIAFFAQKDAMTAFLAKLPKRLPVGTEALDKLSKAIAVYKDRPPSDTVYAFAAIVDRLASPSDLIRFAAHYAGSTDPAIIRSSHACGAVQIALSESALEVERLRVALAGERDLQSVSRILHSYHDRISVIARTLEEAPSDPWIKRLANIRRLASDLMAKELDALLFMMRRTISIVENRGREIVPDPSTVNEAIFGMTLLMIARDTKESLALNTLIEGLEKGIEDALESQGKQAIDRLGTASEENWDAARARSEAALKLFGIYYGRAYAASMSRRQSSIIEERDKKLAS